MNAFWLTLKVFRQADPGSRTLAHAMAKELRESGRKTRILRSHFVGDNGIPYFRVQWWYEMPDDTKR